MMKNPHLTLVCLIMTMTAFIACDKSAVDSAEPITDVPIEQRCCDEIGDNPLFNDAYDDIRVGLIEPVQDIFEAMDPDYIEYLLFQYEKCIAQNAEPVTCVDSFIIQLGVKEYLETLNHELFDSLRLQYPHLTDEEFSDQFAEAVLDLSDNRRLPCYAKFESKVTKIFTDMIIPSLDPFYQVKKFRDLLEAYNDFCNCIYNEYGQSCF